MSARLDVRRALLRRGWREDQPLFLMKAAVEVGCNSSDVFVSGPARRAVGRATVSAPSDVPTRVIVALCEAWAGAPDGER